MTVTVRWGLGVVEQCLRILDIFAAAVTLVRKGDGLCLRTWSTLETHTRQSLGLRYKRNADSAGPLYNSLHSALIWVFKYSLIRETTPLHSNVAPLYLGHLLQQLIQLNTKTRLALTNMYFFYKIWILTQTAASCLCVMCIQRLYWNAKIVHLHSKVLKWVRVYRANSH